jgi:hypothetical protein
LKDVSTVHPDAATGDVPEFVCAMTAKRRFPCVGAEPSVAVGVHEAVPLGWPVVTRWTTATVM